MSLLQTEQSTQLKAVPKDLIDGSLVISIVNWEQADLTIDCLRSLACEVGSFSDCHVIVVDNGSRDDSADRLQQAIEDNGWGAWTTLVRAPINAGFAAGNNIALRRARDHRRWPDFMLLLNSDTVVRPGALRHLMRFMQDNPSVGIAGALNEEPDGEPQPSHFRFHGLRSEICSHMKLGLLDKLLDPRPGDSDDKQPRSVDWVCGACMMIRTEVFDSIGLLDEGFFLYYEETDFVLRAKRAGWSCWYVPDSRIVHLCGKSSGVSWRDSKPNRRPEYLFQSRHRYFVKNHGVLFAALVDGCAIAAFALWRLRRFLQRKPDRDPPWYLWDLVRHSTFVRGRQIEPSASARPSKPRTGASPQPSGGALDGHMSSNQA